MKRKFKCQFFFEPDLDKQLTAVAMYTNGRKLDNVELMKEKSGE